MTGWFCGGSRSEIHPSIHGENEVNVSCDGSANRPAETAMRRKFAAKIVPMLAVSSTPIVVFIPVGESQLLLLLPGSVLEAAAGAGVDHAGVWPNNRAAAFTGTNSVGQLKARTTRM